MDIPITQHGSIKPLSELTLADTFSVYLSFPGTSLTTFHDELCDLKNDPNYVNPKTVIRWRMGESRPRKSVLLPEDLRSIFSGVLHGAFSDRDHMMLQFIANVLESEIFKFDTSDIKAAGKADPSAALSILLDILSFTVLDKENGDHLSPLTDKLHSLAAGSDAQISAGGHPNAADSAAGRGNDGAQRTGSAVIRFTAPPVPFDVEYFVRHIKNGKDEFLSGKDLMPVNRNIRFEDAGDAPRSMQAVIDGIPLDIGFQFKCFARCDSKNVPQLCELLAAHIDYSHARFKTADQKTYYSKRYDEELELIATSFAEPDTVWFILPNYSIYTTFDPFINNYFLPEFRD